MLVPTVVIVCSDLAPFCNKCVHQVKSKEQGHRNVCFSLTDKGEPKKYTVGSQAVIIQQYTVYSICYMLYDLLSATDDIQVKQRGSDGILSVAESKSYSVKRIPYSVYFYVITALELPLSAVTSITFKMCTPGVSFTKICDAPYDQLTHYRSRSYLEILLETNVTYELLHCFGLHCANCLALPRGMSCVGTQEPKVRTRCTNLFVKDTPR